MMYRGFKLVESDLNGQPYTHARKDLGHRISMAVYRLNGESAKVPGHDIPAIKAWIDQRVFGEAPAVVVETPGNFAQALESMAADYEQRMCRLQEEIDEVRGRSDPRIERWKGMLLLEGEPSESAINQAFKDQAKRWHPDQGGDAAVFQRLQAAKDGLLKHC